jgi:hypothetical protein
MKNNQIILILSALLMIAVMGTIALLTVTMKFEGETIENEETFQVDYDHLNKTLTHYMTFEKGEKISVEGINLEGELTLSIDDMRGHNIYKNRGVKREKRIFEMPHEGKYVISVVGSEAKGFVDFKKPRASVQ